LHALLINDLGIHTENEIGTDFELMPALVSNVALWLVDTTIGIDMGTEDRYYHLY
jgi:hypothetical protein